MCPVLIRFPSTAPRTRQDTDDLQDRSLRNTSSRSAQYSHRFRVLAVSVGAITALGASISDEIGGTDDISDTLVFRANA